MDVVKLQDQGAGGWESEEGGIGTALWISMGQYPQAFPHPGPVHRAGWSYPEQRGVEGAVEPAGHLPLSPVGCPMSHLTPWPILPLRPAAEAELVAAGHSGFLSTGPTTAPFSTFLKDTLLTHQL